MLSFKSVNFICFSLYVLVGANAGSVNFIDKCQWEDSACILASAKKAMPHFISGIPELGVPSLESVELKEVNADTGELKLKFKNLVITQIPKCELIKVERPEKLKVKIIVESPITIFGQYVIDGQLLFTNVFGDGDFKFKTDKIRIEALIDLSIVQGKDGKEHYNIGKFDYEILPIEKVFINFENLYNGDAAKAEPILELINKSWKDITLSIGQPVIKEIVVTIIKSIGKFFKAVSPEEIEH